jgi:hypothetical protein
MVFSFCDYDYPCYQLRFLDGIQSLTCFCRDICRLEEGVFGVYPLV